jgi:addiction module RelE/StbE family toxin
MLIGKTPGFERSHRKRILINKELSKVFDEKLLLFEKEPYHPSLDTHKLSGKLKGFWAFTIAYDCRVIFDLVEPDKAMLIDVGKHDEVY